MIARRYFLPFSLKRNAFTANPSFSQSLFEGTKTVRPLPSFWSSSVRPERKSAVSLVENAVGTTSMILRTVGGGNRREAIPWITPFFAR